MTTERSQSGDRRDRGERQKDEEKRGRSRDRREKKKGRSRDRGRRRETDKSHGSKPLLVPAEAAPAPAPSADAAAPTTREEASHDDEEGEEESVLAEDPPVKPPAKRAAPQSSTSDSEAAKAACPGPAKAESEAVARREGDQPPHQGETSEKRDQGHKPDGEKHKFHQAGWDDKRHQGGKDDKTARYDCSICGRKVEGGVAGSWQHRRSGHHLASYVYWNNKETLPWKNCLQEGQRWSRYLWATNQAGPEDDALPNKPTKKQRSPVPVRCDPERSRRDKDHTKTLTRTKERGRPGRKPI